MTSAEWHGQWSRLAQFRVSADANRDAVELEWFAQLKHYHVDAVDHGITELIGHAKDTFLPGLGLLKDLIQTKFDRYQRTDGKCPTCHGSTWTSAQPWMSNGVIYEGFERCRDCGVPEPSYRVPEGRRILTATDARAYASGELQSSLEMPVSRGRAASKGRHGMSRFQAPEVKAS